MAPIFCDRCGETVQAERCNLVEELAHFDALLARLVLKRCELKRKINHHHSHIIRRLPADVMSTIFKFCVPDFADLQPWPSTMDASVPLSLGAICSYWREIAWSTPCLWSSLVVRANTSQVVAIVQQWLGRSGQRPLSIRIFSDLPVQRSDPIFPQAVSALADVINQYSARWSDLHLHMSPRLCQLFHGTDNHAPILKSIGLHGSKYDAGKIQLTCPHLERANLSLYEMNGIHIQSDNLTHINLDRINIIDCFHVLRKNPRLVFCKISNTLISGPRSDTSLILTSLRSLQIMGSIPNDHEIMHNLITPHLEELSLSYSKDYHLPMENVTSFLTQSACSLLSFSVAFTPSPYLEDLMISLLRLIPSLKTLSMTFKQSYGLSSKGYGLLRNILQLLNKILSSQSASPQQRFLPSLEVLEYTGEQRLPPRNYADLNPLPPADNAVHGPFHLLKLDVYSNRIPENHLSHLLNLGERGVRVEVFSESEDILQSSINYYKEEKGRYVSLGSG